MKCAIAIMCCFAFAGCDVLQDRTVNEGVQSVSKNKQELTGDLKTEYPAPSSQAVAVTASGNANVSVCIPKQESDGIVKLTNKTAEKVSSDNSFSFDRHIKSVSLGGWIAILLLMLMIMVLALYFLKQTIVGRAMDAAVGAGIDSTHRIISDLTEKVSHADPTSPEWRQFNELRNRHQDKLAELLRQSRK